MAWRRLGDKPLSEPMMDSLLTHICVTQPQWVKVTQFPALSQLAFVWILASCFMILSGLNPLPLYAYGQIIWPWDLCVLGRIGCVYSWVYDVASWYNIVNSGLWPATRQPVYDLLFPDNNSIYKPRYKIYPNKYAHGWRFRVLFSCFWF